ncbi:GntR family transcriptional regulator / MocR family aminotransferase [Parapedobacter indicus]|uniref:GntR family transcriptional regulator / MocR family aminotransferase n=1 Tax=Parapedobacter indicus TaxID=1477437 RepID=A0A1I3VAQ4_9SPHI|nr:PLP-dependent aminotransferase family protein [Parapedobacter indicus]PPK98931.1 GntR family transcriptional regulator/MocR family aminotransferase [Parapedobacter indicus]SFJ92544.1 GntR family transcriptional regulator / MocR family aminotransferase [Parapedobacter indicus]
MIRKLLQITFKKDGQHSPLYLQLESEIIQLICRGILKPGQVLPPSRELAQSLRINRKTVVKTYEELNAQGWVEIRDRSGVYVSGNLPDTAARRISQNSEKLIRSRQPAYPLISRSADIAIRTSTDVEINAAGIPAPLYRIDDGFPDPRIAPIEELIREYRRYGKSHLANHLMMYGPEHGSYHLRVELANFLNRTRGMQVSEKEILITKGTQMAIYLTAQVLIRPGDSVFVPDPGYHAANQVFNLLGAHLTFIPVDKDGMDIDRIEQLCLTKQTPKLVYIIPHHHRPTTVTLCAERRMRLMNLAHKYRFAVLEDDYDFDYHFSSNPLLPLASLDSGSHIIYVGSFCKSIAPGIRIGFMVAPEVVINEAAAIRKLIDRQGEQLLEESLAELLRTGDISRHLKKSHKLYEQRLENSCRLLQEQLGPYLTFERPNGGLAIWAKYRKDISAKAVARKASKLGLKISDGSNYFFQPNIIQPDNFIRIGYCSLDETEMAGAIDVWKQALVTFGLK